MSYVQITTHGFKELAAKLKLMPDDIMEKTVKKAVYESAKIVRDDARLRAPKHEGMYPPSRMEAAGIKALKQEIKESLKEGGREGYTRKQKKAYTEMFKKGVLITGRQLGQKPRKPGTLEKSIYIAKPKIEHSKITTDIKVHKKAWYGKFFELGKGFKAGGKTFIPTRPYLRPALDENAEMVLNMMRIELSKGVDRVMAK